MKFEVIGLLGIADFEESITPFKTSVVLLILVANNIII